MHSLVRTYFYGRKPPGPTHNAYGIGKPNIEEIKNHQNRIIEERKSYLKGNVFRWWFLFPISLLNWILSDLIEDVYDFIYNKLQRLYVRVLMMGFPSVKED